MPRVLKKIIKDPYSPVSQRVMVRYTWQWGIRAVLVLAAACLALGGFTLWYALSSRDVPLSVTTTMEPLNEQHLSEFTETALRRALQFNSLHATYSPVADPGEVR